MIRKLEYLDKDNNRQSYAFKVGEDLENTIVPDLSINYLDDPNYLEDINNGYIDADGNATSKLLSTIKHIERINENTWEFVLTNVSRFDNRSVRTGNITGIKTLHDQWGNKSELVTGIGDFEDCIINRIDQETDPDIMSKDLFIGNMSGFTVGFSSGLSNDVVYAQVLNPVNSDNVNNYYPVVNHGYFYDGEVEYFTYGNKQTEILNPDFIELDSDGNGYYSLSGYPNIHSPMLVNMVQDTYQNVVASIQISDFEVFSRNSHRERFDSLPTSLASEVFHGLVTEQPFVYLVNDDGTIGLPDVSISSKNEILIDAPSEEFHGYVNVLRPNTNFREFLIDVRFGDLTLNHGMNSTNLFVFFSLNNEIALIESAIVDVNNLYIPQLGISGKLIIFDVTEYAEEFYYASFSSGVINHNMNLAIEGNETYYIDPWVFGSKPLTPTTDEIVIADTQIIDKDNIYVDFGETVTDVTISVIDFWKLNLNGAVFQDKFALNTDQFSFQETLFYGNQGIATPFHKIYPLQDNLVGDIGVKEFLLRSQPSGQVPRPLDFIEGYYDNLIGYPLDPTYITEDNKLFIPNTMSGVPVITYEKEKTEAYEFRFRGTDVSPVSWYNSDRIIAIQPFDQPLGNLYIYPDIKSINLSDSTTRVMAGNTTPLPLQYYPYDIVEGEPTTSANFTLLATDDAEVALKDELVKLSSKRRLYKKVDDELTRLYDYDVDIIDNTSGLFGIASGIIGTVLSGLTVYSPSLFDEISFAVSQGETDIYDDDGYLFTTITGRNTYRVPFVGSLYDEGADELTHELYKQTNVFGSAVATVGFHNNRRLDRVKTVRVTALPSGQTEFTTTVVDSATILVKPFTPDDMVGSVDSDDNPNPTINIHPVINGNTVTVLPDANIPTTSTMRLYDRMQYNEASGVISRVGTGGIIDVYDTGNEYIAEIDYDYEPLVASGVASGYTAFASGILIRFDEIDDSASLFGRGEYYD